MNEGTAARLEGFEAQLEVDGRTLTILDGTGGTFTALLLAVPMVDPRTELLQDPREMAQIQTNDAPDRLQANAAVRDDGGTIWILLKREDNTADFVTTFWAQKQTTQDA